VKRTNPSKRQIILLTFVFALIAVYPLQAARSEIVATVVSVVPQMNSARVGDTFTVNVTVSNVQNLYAVEVTLTWNSSVLRVQDVSLQLGVESHPGGVLHETQNASVLVAESNVTEEAGQYYLVATSVSPAASFSGSGTIASIRFNVTSVGHSEIELRTVLANYPLQDDTSTPIDHTDVSGSIDAVVPEFPSIVIVAVLLVFVTGALLLSKRVLRKGANQALTHSLPPQI
jgi:hypothetical protein